MKKTYIIPESHVEDYKDNIAEQLTVGSQKASKLNNDNLGDDNDIMSDNDGNTWYGL